MPQTSRYNIGLRFGENYLVYYMRRLFDMYKFFVSSPLFLGVFAIISYFVILLMFLFTGIDKKKELGGQGV